MGRPVVIGHCPRYGEKTEEEREWRSPAGAVGKRCEDPFWTLLVGGKEEQGKTDSDGSQDVDRGKPEDNPVQGFGG